MHGNWKLVYFGITYALVFTGYYVTTGFLNIVYPETAFIGFAIFYAVAGLGCLVSPYIVSKLPLKVSLIGAAALYLLFIAASASYISPFMLTAYGFCGVGSSIIWLIQGIWTSAFKKDSQGLSMGIFYSIFSVNLIFGNIIGLIILSTGVDLQKMLWSMLGLSGLGLVMCLFIPAANVEIPRATTSLWVRIMDVLKTTKTSYFLIPMICAQSFGLNVTFQILPKLVSKTIGPVDIYNAAMFLTYGISSAISSLTWGKIFDKSWRCVVYSYTGLEIACLVAILVMSKFSKASGYWIIIGFVRGVTDNAVNNVLNTTFSRVNPVNAPESFAFYRLVYSFTYIIGSIITGYVPYEYVLLIAGIVCLSGTLSYHFHRLPIETASVASLEEIGNQFAATAIEL